MQTLATRPSPRPVSRRVALQQMGGFLAHPYLARLETRRRQISAMLRRINSLKRGKKLSSANLIHLRSVLNMLSDYELNKLFNKSNGNRRRGAPNRR